ncbi:hypothetical protein ACNKXS_13880 [Christiangramia marina]|uniref:hypothetical protein n=1 Tax=Christiangramia marina TaxID=409436 RepID=UPI003AA8B3E6
MRFISILILSTLFFSVNASEYACPEVSSPSQSFCINNGPTVADLRPTNVLWFSSTDSGAIPLAEATPLIDSMVYYAGDQEGTCITRPQVIVTLVEQAYAGEDALRCYSKKEIDYLIKDLGDIQNFYLDMLSPGVPRNGDFYPGRRAIAEQYNSNSYGDFKMTYTVSNGNCEDSVDLTLRVQQENPSGEKVVITLLKNQSPVNLIDYLDENITRDGIWNRFGNGIFDPASDEEGEFIYMTGGCGSTDSATVSVSVIPPGCPTVLKTTQSFCRSSFPGNKISDLVATDNGGGVAWYSDNSSTTALSFDTNIEDGGIYYAGSSDGANCVNERIAVTVDFIDTPNSGKTTYLAFDSNDQTVDLRDLIKQTEPDWPVDGDGFMTPGTSGGGTVFTPSLDGNWTGEKQFRHTVTSTSECPDDDTFVYITINAQPNSGHRLVYLGGNQIEAQNYLNNNEIQNEEGLLVNIWTASQLEINSVYKINVAGEDRFYYVNKLYSDPQSEPDLTLTSNTEIEQNLAIEVSNSTLQEVTEVGSNTNNRINFQGGVTMSNDQLLLEGNTMSTSFPLSIASNNDLSSIKVFDGVIVHSNTENTLEDSYNYKGKGELHLSTNTVNSELSLLSDSSGRNQLLTLELDEKAISVNSRKVQGHYSIRQELDSLPGNLDLIFENKGMNPISFQSDTTTVFSGQLQLGSSIESGYDLVVEGAMISESMVMKIESNWPDYVFQQDYKLSSLASIKSFIKKHHHLPGLPTSKEVTGRGLNIAETNRVLLEKVEELTLHLLQLKKEVNAIDIQNIKLSQEINK